MNDLADLNNRFAIPGHVEFENGPGGLTLARIDNHHASAAIALQGSQLISWTPINSEPVIWLSHAASLAPGKTIRGGIPICWPWFGAHPDDDSLPAHGFARTALWQVEETIAMDDGTTRISLVLPQDQMPARMWPHATDLECLITVGENLELELNTVNRSEQEITVGEALHTYFAVSDVRNISVDGLDGGRYLDKVDDFKPKRQEGPVTFNGEVDRIYLDSLDDCLICDPGLGRRIRINKQDSNSTVVWNPWADKAACMGDLGEDGYLNMVCVESANAADNVISLAPGAQHRLCVRYSVEALGT
jgi:glucose-6-phosphate 1-epimerase